MFHVPVHFSQHHLLNRLTNSEGKETGSQINDLEKEEINIQPEQNEETRILKNERLRNLWDNFKHSNIQIIGVPEGEEEEQDLENLFENIMKENFPNLAKEIDFARKSRKFRESQRSWSQRSWTQRSTHKATS